MATVGRLVVEVITDIAKFTEGMDSVAGRAKRVGDSLTKFGALATAGVTLPLAGIGAAAIRASTELNAAMANVASLGVPAERVDELKTSVQDLAIEVGKSTGDMADGLYQVISAFGDTADTVSILEINARAAAAGLATTTDAINLTSAVTKGYGDVSAEAVGKVADLAFQAVKLGQTTFPELASSMGKVVPIAASLGVKQEELFAQMATLTGVTGTAAEVSTQLRATFQAILAPSEDMANVISEIAILLDEQGRLVGGPVVEQWRQARETWVANSQRLEEMRQELATLELQMASSSNGARNIRGELQALRLETKQQVLALREQLMSIDTTTDAGKEQARAIREQIQVLRLTSQQRELELQQQLMAASGSQILADRYKRLKEAIKEQEKVTEDSAKTMEEYAAGMGQSIVSSVGFTDALNMIVEAAGGNTNTLRKMFGSVEALNAVLALSGPQADVFAEKLDAMEKAVGATDKAFEAQTEGINKTGFTMAQVRAKTEVLMQRLGDGLAPALLKVLEQAEPLIDRVIDLANRFANADGETQTWIVTIGAAVAAIGPVVTAVGMFISGVSSLIGVVGSVIGILGGGGAVAGTLAGALTLLTGPVGLIVAAVVGLAAAWTTNFMGIRDKTQAAVDWIIEKFNQLLSVDWGSIGSGIVSGIANGIRSGIGWISDAARQAAQSALDAAKSFLGIGSPSRLAAREIGGPFVMGFRMGAIAELDRVMRDVANQFRIETERITAPNLAPAGAGAPVSISIRQEFYGAVDAETVRHASEMGIKEAMRRIGMR